MITEIQDDILLQLQGIAGVMTVDEWEGEVEDLIKQPNRFPGVFVIYGGADFSSKSVIGSNRADHTMEFAVIVIARNLRSRTEGARTCYGIIEAVRTKLIGHVIGNYGPLWPVGEELLFVEKGTLAYGLKYELKTKTS